MKPTQTLTLDEAGRLALPPPVARDLQARPLEVASHSNRHLLLTAPGDEGRVVLAGLVGELSVADLLSFCNMFRLTGVLRFDLTGGRKTLFFDQGEVALAASTFPEEDIGEVLFLLGKVERPALQKARQLETSRTSVGLVLVEEEEVTAKDLWLATRHQIESIVFSLFGHHQGGFSFLARPLEKDETVRLSMNTQNLIMEGLRRADEGALFMRRICSLEAVPSATGEREEGIEEDEQGLLALVKEMAGSGNVREVVRKSGLGEFEALRLLYQLVEKGTVRLDDAPAVTVPGDLGRILEIFNGVLGAIFRRVSERNGEFSQELRVFLRDLPPPFSYVLRDVTPLGDGTLDGGRILANLGGLDETDQKRLLADALNEIVYMECLAARRDLGTEASAELVSRVQEVTRRVRHLIGRNE